MCVCVCVGGEGGVAGGAGGVQNHANSLHGTYKSYYYKYYLLGLYRKIQGDGRKFLDCLSVSKVILCHKYHHTH